ncbi:MAG: thermonuclease family protein [Anaerolineales bacterium]|nr:thermonuclease family protein [Anaerolineales bacterium]
MRQWLFLLVLALLSLSACIPAPVALVPPETLAAQTLAARPSTNTPLPTDTPLPTNTPTPPEGLPTPTLDLNIAGAYCLPVDTQRMQGLVTKVISGDTIEVLIRNLTYPVRYIGVDAPSILAPAEWQAAQAMGFNQSLVEGKYVTLVQDVTDRDAEGYYPRYVLIENVFVNYEMILRGYGMSISVPPDTACANSLLSAVVEAQKDVRGIWIPTPIPTSTITLTPTITNTPLPPTETRVQVCNCKGPRLTCNSFPSQTKAQQCFEYCRSMGFGDIFGLDKNGNGLACEGLSN